MVAWFLLEIVLRRNRGLVVLSTRLSRGKGIYVTMHVPGQLDGGESEWREIFSTPKTPFTINVYLTFT